MTEMSVDPVLVKVVDSPKEPFSDCAEFGVLTTFALTGTEIGVQILGYDPMRHRARIVINNNPANSAQVGAYVIIGTRAQCQANLASISGGRYQPGDNITIENVRDYYVTGDGIHPVDVVVLNERHSNTHGPDRESIEDSIAVGD